jgi:hypothetical protein
MKKIFLITFLSLITTISQSNICAADDYQTIINKNNKIGIVKRFPPADYSSVYDSNKPFPVYNESLNEMYQVYVISADLQNYNLSDRYNDLIHSSFDTKTKWPKVLPNNFNPYLIMDIGKDPGLTIRELHKEGIWSDTIKVQCQNCRKCKENGNEKVRSKI